MASRHKSIQAIHEYRRRTGAVQRYNTRQFIDARIAESIEQRRNRHLALSTDSAVDCAGGVFQQVVRYERSAVAANEDVAILEELPGRFGEVDNLGNIG